MQATCNSWQEPALEPRIPTNQFTPSTMRKIYENFDYAKVGHYESILNAEGIPTHVKNLGASIGLGEIPFTQIYPELWVVNDSDYDRAIELLKPIHELQTQEFKDWKCTECGAEVEGNFGECWNCGTLRPSDAEAAG